MKQITKYLVMLIVTIASTQVSDAQTKNPSGVVSVNGQETNDNDNILYPSASEYVEFLTATDPQIPQFTKYNGAVVAGVRITYNRNHYQAQAKKLQADAVTQTEKQLKAINERDGIFGSNTTVKGNKNYLLNHIKIMNLKFNADTVYLMGEKGDFTGISWILHKSNDETNADGLYYVLVTNSGKHYIISRVSCWNNVTVKETFWLETGKAEVVDVTVPKPKRNEPKPQGLNGGGDDYRAVSFVDSAGRTVNIYINSAGGQGGSVVIGDITAKGGSSNNNNSNTGGAGRDGKDGRDGVVVYSPPPGQQYAPVPQGNGWQHQDRYSVSPTGVYIDRSFQYFNSLPSQSLAMNNPWWGGNGYGLFMNQGQQYMVPGNWNNGMFQANWNNCYQWRNNSWQLAIGVGGAGFFANATFFGGYNCAGGQTTWIPPTNSGWGCNRIPQNTCYNRGTPPPVISGPNMGWTIPAGNQNPGGAGRPGGPGMGYTIR